MGGGETKVLFGVALYWYLCFPQGVYINNVLDMMFTHTCMYWVYPDPYRKPCLTIDCSDLILCPKFHRQPLTNNIVHIKCWWSVTWVQGKRRSSRDISISPFLQTIEQLYPLNHQITDWCFY